MKSWRAWVPALAVGLPIVLALVLIFLFIDGVIGAATAIAACFALGAVAITVLMLHGEEREDSEDSDQGPWMRE